ncbi:DUF4365 domain-containing protein [Streptomyces antimicrobicus]|uniref:DUF4365 domain-containing protein n=1 Tax=Streptomyces antimicrobicus TaxID=2883108 RepID=A0ABS8AZK1_9ACTN|nr:DUF4365 domain-containing protein [Streptomyces antimicrobicus]MCB5177787.1 DUF4365 domain-containing protein [Streptomyces antimicrobicus]
MDTDGKPRKRNIEAVDDRTVTTMMEQLQVGYVSTVAATAGCSVEVVGKDVFGVDVQFIRPGRNHLEQESLLFAQLKCTTLVVPDRDEKSFRYRFSKREYFEGLSVVRSYPKKILIVMTVPLVQREWTEVLRGGLLVKRECYWTHLAGATSELVKPTIDIPTENVFDAQALVDILDRQDRGESLAG